MKVQCISSISDDIENFVFNGAFKYKKVQFNKSKKCFFVSMTFSSAISSARVFIIANDNMISVDLVFVI